MQEIENLDLLYGQITWEQVYLVMVLWTFQLMDIRYKPLREHMKLKLPSNTKELLKEPNETLDKIMTMMTQWENPTMSFHDTKEMKARQKKPNR